MLVYQGDYGSLGGLASVASRMARFDVIVLSHASDRGPGRANTGGCLDTRFAPLPDLIRLVRRINPEVLVFGYISATADAPIGSGCGLGPGARYGERPWQCPERVCRNSMSWVDDWLDLDAEVDGIFVDLVAASFISAETRDSIFSYIRSSGLQIMANTTIPSASNVAFAASSRYLAEGDFLMIEGILPDRGTPECGPDARGGEPDPAVSREGAPAGGARDGSLGNAAGADGPLPFRAGARGREFLLRRLPARRCVPVRHGRFGALLANTAAPLPLD